jgi:hypothetical protein
MQRPIICDWPMMQALPFRRTITAPDATLTHQTCSPFLIESMDSWGEVIRFVPAIDLTIMERQ